MRTYTIDKLFASIQIHNYDSNLIRPAVYTVTRISSRKTRTYRYIINARVRQFLISERNHFYDCLRWRNLGGLSVFKFNPPRKFFCFCSLSVHLRLYYLFILPTEKCLLLGYCVILLSS